VAFAIVSSHKDKCAIATSLTAGPMTSNSYPAPVKRARRRDEFDARINGDDTAGRPDYGVADGIGTTRGAAGIFSAGLSGAFFPPKISGIFISV